MATSFPRGIQFCVGEDLAYRIVDLTFHGQWHIARVRCQTPCSSRFACLGNHRSHVVLPLIKLHKQGAATVLPSCPCYFTHLGPDLYGRRSCARITTLGLPASKVSNGSRWTSCSAKKSRCEVVGGHEFSQGDSVLCWGRSGLSDC